MPPEIDNPYLLNPIIEAMDIRKRITIDDIRSKEAFYALDEVSAKQLLETIVMYCTIVYEASTSQEDQFPSPAPLPNEHTIPKQPKQVISLPHPHQKHAA